MNIKNFLLAAVALAVIGAGGSISIHYQMLREENNKSRTKTNKTVEVNLYADHQKQSQEWIDLAKELHETKQMLKHYKLQEAKLRDKLKALSNNKSSVGGEYVFTAIERLGNINYKEIPELKTVDLDLYRKESYLSWKLTKI